MSTIGERIKELRKKLDLTQSALADKVGMTYVQIGRYEKRGAVPSSEVLKKLADALNTTTDFIMNGNTDEAASKQIRDKELLNLFKEVDKLDNKDKNMIKTFLDALVTKRHLQHLAL